MHTVFDQIAPFSNILAKRGGICTLVRSRCGVLWGSDRCRWNTCGCRRWSPPCLIIFFFFPICTPWSLCGGRVSQSKFWAHNTLITVTKCFLRISCCMPADAKKIISWMLRVLLISTAFVLYFSTLSFVCRKGCPRCEQDTLYDKFPVLAAQWHPTLNRCGTFFMCREVFARRTLIFPKTKRGLLFSGAFHITQCLRSVFSQECYLGHSFHKLFDGESCKGQ